MAHFNWNIFIPTPTHYVDLLEPQIVFPTDLIHGRLIAKEIYPEVVERLMEFVHYFLDISMQVCTVWTINDCQRKTPRSQTQGWLSVTVAKMACPRPNALTFS